MRILGRRVAAAAAVLLTAVAACWLDRDAYTDTSDGRVSLTDALYFATVSLSTTGYGDIVPVSDAARLVNILVITPLRLLFVIILVGTTMEVLTEHFRAERRINRWRRRLRNHTVVLGYGTKGRAAVDTLLAGAVAPETIVVVDASPAAIEEANALGVAGVLGDATRTEILDRAEVSTAAKIIVSASRDDTAVLITLTARDLNADAPIVASVREQENAHLLRRSGADIVVTSSDAAGRLLGTAATHPAIAAVMQDLVSSGPGLNLIERIPRDHEIDGWIDAADDLVVAVLRGGRLRSLDDPGVRQLRATDRLICIGPRP